MADTDNAPTENNTDFDAPKQGERNTDVSGATIGETDDFADATATPPATPEMSATPAQTVADVAADASETAASVKDQAADALAQGKQAATQVLDQGKQAAGQALEQGKQVASQALEQGKEAAGQAIDNAKGQIVTELGTRKDTLAQTLEGAVQALHSTSQQFRDQNIPYVGEYADTFANQVQKASEYLRGKDVTELARDAERVAKENPVAFVAGAFFLGLALARFLKSSAEGSPLAFAQNNGNGTVPASEALVPYTGNGGTTSSTKGNYTMPELADPKSRDVFSDNVITAHDYVPGGVAGGG